MNLHALMQQFAQFDGAQVGCGPKHPTAPNPEIATEIDPFLTQYLFLCCDAGYIDFLESYSGASILQQGSNLTVDILGFTGTLICSHMLEMEDSIVDEDGYLLFGYIMLEDKPVGNRQLSFGFDATQDRPPGVYRYATIDTRAQHKHWHWYCATFCDWLERLIQSQGRLADTP